MKARMKILKKQSNFPLAPPSSENLGPKIGDFKFFMAGAFSIAFSAINSIATHYESTCEDCMSGAFTIAFPAIKVIHNH